MLENAHALLIGIADYKNIRKLPKTVTKDVLDIYDLIISPAYCAYKAENVTVLSDGQATQTAIRQAFRALSERCDRDSVVFIYISSHGGQIESGPRTGEYLLPVDVEVDFSCKPPLISAESAISGDEFTEMLGALAARKVVVIFDCCHSGGVGQPKDGLAPTFKVGLPEDYYDVLKSGTGRVILASSRGSEYSYILSGDQNSLFTKHLLSGLRGGIHNEDGFITIFDLFEYVQPKVTLDSPNQHPIFKAEIEQNFPIALRLGGEKSAAPKVEGEYLYDVYVSYAEDSAEDADWVWETLWPRLEAVGLKVAISDDVAQPGVSRVVNIERGIKQSRRTLVILSPNYFEKRMAQFENIMAQTLSIEQGKARMITVILKSIDTNLLPGRLNPNVVFPADLSRPGARAERQFDKLVRTLQGPLESLF